MKKTIIFSSIKVSPEEIEYVLQQFRDKSIKVLDVIYTAPDDDILNDIDFITVVGGDGTIIRASYLFSPIPILAVYKGGMGALTEVVEDNIPIFIEKLLKGMYTMEENIRISGTIESEKGPTNLGDALNEFFVFKADQEKIVNFELHVNNEKFYSFRGDGFIIATPIGSTAHAFSYDDTIILPGTNAFIFVPLGPLYGKFPSIIIPSNHKLTVSFDRKIIAIADGHRKTIIDPTVKISFKKSERVTYFIRFRSPIRRMANLIEKIYS